MRGCTPSWDRPPSRLTRTPSQEKLIIRLRYREVLDWIAKLPLPHIKKMKGPVRAESLRGGNLLWDIALHVLRPDLPNNRDEIERYETLLEQPEVASNAEKRCRALRCLGQSYHQMNLYGSAIEMHTLQLRFASALDSGGTLEMMQQAIGDLGDVFRSLGEKEIAQNMYKSSLGIPDKRKRTRSRGNTPGELQPWPTTPNASIDVLSLDREGSGTGASAPREVFPRKKAGKSAPASRLGKKDGYTSSEVRQNVSDDGKTLPMKEAFSFGPEDVLEGSSKI